MVTLNELKKKLNSLNETGKILGWKTVKDNGEVIIINIGYPTEKEVVNYENAVIRVYNRNTEEEFIRWERRKPMVIKEEKTLSQFETYIKNNRTSILHDLKEKYNVIKLVDFNINKDREYIIIRAFMDKGNNTISEKEFMVMFNEKGNYFIYIKV